MPPFRSGIVCVLIASPCLAAGAPVTSGVQAVADVGVISPDGKLVFLAGKDGLEAVDTASGKTKWNAKSTARPFLVAQGVVLGWAAEGVNKIALIGFKADTGEEVFAAKPVPTADWVVVGAEVHGKSFAIQAKGESAGVVVGWVARSSYFGGAAPTPEIEEAARKRAAGYFRIVPKDGEISAMKGEPKDEEFYQPNGKPLAATFGYEFTVERSPPPQPFGTVKRKLVAVKDGKEAWTRELPGKQFLPPPP